MNPAKFLTSAAAALAAVFLVSCADQTKPGSTAATKEVNPFPPGTYDHFKAEKSYPKTSKVWKNDELLAKTDPSNSRILISLGKQRGFLMNDDEVVIDYPICSGTATRPTPKGAYQITEKVVDKKSNKYGRIYDASGECVNSDADIAKDPVPEGGRFEGAGMRYWMRLTNDGVGHHIGPVKRYPASHACIRGPSAVMPIVYSKMKIGSTVKVED